MRHEWSVAGRQAGRQTGRYRGRQRGSLFSPLISPDWDNWMGLLENCNSPMFEFLYYVSEQLLSGCCWDIKRFSTNITKNASRITYKPYYWSGLKQLSYVPTWALKQTLLAVIYSHWKTFIHRPLRFECWWGTKSTVLVLYINAFQSLPKVNLRLQLLETNQAGFLRKQAI